MKPRTLNQLEGTWGAGQSVFRDSKVEDEIIGKFALMGASGRVGRLIASAGANRDSPWHTVPLQYRRPQTLFHSRNIPWDVADGPDGLLKWMDRFGALETLIVMAGVTPATSSDMTLNTVIAKAYLDAAMVAGIKRVLLASSSAVYGFGDGSPMSEAHSCAPVNTYGKSKLDMEAMARNVAADTNMEICCLRIGNIAGADAVLLNASKATPEAPLIIDCFPDGAGPLRSYIGPTQAGEVLAKLACHQGALPSVLNLAGTAPIQMEELAIAAALPWRYATAPLTARQSITLDCSVLAALIDMPRGTHDAKMITLDWLGAKRNDTPKTPI